MNVSRLRVAGWLMLRWLLLASVVGLFIFCGGGLFYKFCWAPACEVWQPALAWMHRLMCTDIGIWFLLGVFLLVLCGIRYWLTRLMCEDDMPDYASEQSKLVADAPVRKIEDDWFTRGAYVQMLASLIMSKPSVEGARYVGVYAPWGDGKTSVRYFLEERIEQDYGVGSVVFVDFAPWEYPNDFDVSLVFFEKLAQAVSGICNPGMAGLFSQVAHMLALRRVDQAVGSMQQIVDFARRLWFRFVMPEQKLLKSLYDLLKSSHKRIVVVVDDLERLPQEEVCRVIRFLKTHGDIPSLTYLVLADEDFLSKAVATVVGNSKADTVEEGREYMEKIIPIRCPLPDINGRVLLNVFKKQVDQLLKSYGLQSPDPFTQWELFVPYLQNARKMKILLNAYSVQLATFKRKVGGHQYLNISLEDLLSLTLMKVFEPKFYSALAGGYWRVYQETSPYDSNSGISEGEFEKLFLSSVKSDHHDVVRRFLREIVGIIEVGGDKRCFRLENPRKAELLSRYRLASLYCFSNYFISETEDLQLTQDDLQEFVQSVRNGIFPLKLIENLDKDGRLPYLLYALEDQPLFETRAASDSFMRILTQLSALQLRDAYVSDTYEPSAFMGRTGIYTRIFRCLLFYCTKIKQRIMSGQQVFGIRLGHVGDLLLPVLKEVDDDVYILSEFIAHDNERHRGTGRDYDAYFSDADYEQLKNVFLDRIAHYQKTGKLIPHLEFFDMFRTWTILLTKQGTEERMQEFREACANMLNRPEAVSKALIFFTRDNRLGASLSDQLFVGIDLERLNRFFGDSSMMQLLNTLEAMPHLDLYAYHALVCLRYVVLESKEGRPCDLEMQREHLIEFAKTESYQQERMRRVVD